MKLVTSVAVLVALLLAVPAAANARKISMQDRMLAEKVVKHIVAMTAIMKRSIEKPKPALAKLEAYLERHGAAIRRLSADIEKAAPVKKAPAKTKAVPKKAKGD